MYTRLEGGQGAGGARTTTGEPRGDSALRIGRSGAHHQG